MASLRSSLVALYLSDSRLDLRRVRHRLTRGSQRRFIYVHQVDDPYGLLLVQVLPALVEAAGATLQILVLPATAPAFLPDPQRLRAWALRDAAGLARQYGLGFPSEATCPNSEALARAQDDALVERPWAQQLSHLRETTHALLAGEALELDARLDPRHRSSQLVANQAKIHARGHYQGGMLYYEGEWYWGLDRLVFLEQRLRDEGLAIPPTLDPNALPIVDAGRLWGAALPDRSDRGTELELFYSLRSPYSYLALDRSLALAARHGVSLRMRPVLPMVMRGLAVPWPKRRYIVTDAKRIAGALGIPFGRISDPVGVGVERCLAVAPLADANDRLPQWLQAVGRAVWSQGVDVATDAGLRAVAASAGIDEHEALACAHGDQSWRAQIEDNRRELLRMGLWGVPCFRFGELTLWGQDRLAVLDAGLSRASQAR